jgi:ABC-type glycerol-3-phosphate transport system substrate-binding protein
MEVKSLMRIKFLAAPTMMLFFMSTGQSVAQSNWQKEWEKTLAEARKEGQVNIYIYRYERLLEDFKKDYPGINVVSVTGRGNELTTRLMSERRAGNISQTSTAVAPAGTTTSYTKAKLSTPSSRR